jgi:hypothetical protein
MRCNEAVKDGTANVVEAVGVTFKINNIVQRIRTNVVNKNTLNTCHNIIEPEVAHDVADDVFSYMLEVGTYVVGGTIWVDIVAQQLDVVTVAEHSVVSLLAIG